MPNRLFATSLIAALADLGVTDAVVSPGSRNTPLIAGLAAEPRVRKWPVIDERSAAFFALGLAKTSGRPVVLACTSGTAAAEYHPAVIEASQSDTPLLVLTADRPEELRNVGAPQTIDQIGLYGTAVRMFADALAPDEATEPGAAADIAIDIWAHATATPAGPVHLNLPFREPLLESSPAATPTPIDRPEDPEHPPVDLSEIAAQLEGRRGLIIAGRTGDQGFAGACASLAAKCGFPVLADVLSGLRFSTPVGPAVLTNADLLAAAGALDAAPPEVILRFGAVPTSKPVWTWLATHPEIPQILIDTQSRDATHSASTVLEIEGTVAANALTGQIGTAAPDEWLDRWVQMDRTAGAGLDDALSRIDFPNEPAIARLVAQNAPDGSAVTVGSSMPIRDVDAFGGKRAANLLMLGNRGTNGIDGIVSAGLGAAAAGRNSVVLVGDVSLFHDLNALGTARQLGLPLTVVVVNNNGGGIFDFLPQADPELLDAEAFETYLATPHDTDFAATATALGVQAETVADAPTLARLISEVPTGPRLIEIRTNRAGNVAIHRMIGEEIRSRLDE